MYIKKIFFSTFILVFSLNTLFSQCAMCKAVVEGGEESIAEGVNNGITYLMIFPYLLVGLIAYFLYKHWKKNKN